MKKMIKLRQTKIINKLIIFLLIQLSTSIDAQTDFPRNAFP